MNHNIANMINRLRAERNKFRDECYELRFDCANAISRIQFNDMQSQLKKKQNEIDALKNQYDQLNRDYNNLHQLYQSCKKEKMSYQTECENLKIYLEATLSNYEKKNKEINNLNASLNSAHETNTIALQNINHIYNMYINTTNEINILKSNLTEEQKFNMKLIKERDQANFAYKTISDEYYKQYYDIINLQKECQQLHIELDKLNTQILNANENPIKNSEIITEKVNQTNITIELKQNHNQTYDCSEGEIKEEYHNNDISEISPIDMSKLNEKTEITEITEITETTEINEKVEKVEKVENSNDSHDEDFDILDYEDTLQKKDEE
jgi:chromosome segregation ATPase